MKTNHGDSSARGRRRFVAAAVLGRKGRYAEAGRELEEAWKSEGCTEAEAMDLGARLYAQQGLYLQSERLWTRAVAVDPGNPAYERGLLRLRAGRVGQGARALALAILAVAVIAAVIGLGAWPRGAAEERPDVETRLDVIHGDLRVLLEASRTAGEAGVARDARLAALETALTDIQSDGSRDEGAGGPVVDGTAEDR